MMTHSVKYLFLALWFSFAIGAVKAQDMNALPDVDDTADLVDDAVADNSDSDADGMAVDAARRRVSGSKSGGKKPVAKKSIAGKKALPKRKSDSGADSEEGWIIQKDKDGTYIKVPRKQAFKFEGDVSAQANRPSQTVLGQRPTYRATTLIPERNSFRREFMDASGYSGGGRSE